MNIADYEWSMLELYDQVVRTSPGGEMGKFWSQHTIINQQTIINRAGNEIVQYRNALKASISAYKTLESTPQVTITGRIKYKLLQWLLKNSDYNEHLRLAKYRVGGEIHQWMYDSFSLGRLLVKCGFKNVVKRDTFTSAIPKCENPCWLDVEVVNTRKPDSLFVEAIK